MYEHHRQSRDASYTNYAIYSPDVPVIREDDGTLYAKPFYCSFVTCAAVNAKALLRNSPGKRKTVLPRMRSRIDRVLEIAFAHNHASLILGAWGCGAFGNDVYDIARLFAETINGRFNHCFQEIVFAITDWSKEKRFIGPFRDVFGIE